jgi:hypothetical protein
MMTRRGGQNAEVKRLDRSEPKMAGVRYELSSGRHATCKINLDLISLLDRLHGILTHCRSPCCSRCCAASNAPPSCYSVPIRRPSTRNFQRLPFTIDLANHIRTGWVLLLARRRDCPEMRVNISIRTVPHPQCILMLYLFKAPPRFTGRLRR